MNGKDSLSMDMVKTVISLSLVFGLIGGVVGTWGYETYSQQKNLSATKTAQVQESSAVIDVAKKVSPSVVSITSQSVGFDFFLGPRTQRAAGTGIIVTADGLILTNKHVVEGAQTLSVFTSDGREHKNARIVATDPTNDLAFIKISGSGFKPAELGDSTKVIVGQKVVAIGNALGQFQNTVTEGIISGLGRPVVAGDEASAESLQDLLQTDAAINPGNSGGPLVDLAGRVIGVNTAIADQAQNIGFAIPINAAKPLIDSVKSTGKITKPFLGVRYLPITKELAASNNLPTSEGAYVTSGGNNPAVVPNSPAAQAGLREGDIITSIDGQKIDERHALSTLVGQHKVGDKIKLTYLREGREVAVTVILAEAPAS